MKAVKWRATHAIAAAWLTLASMTGAGRASTPRTASPSQPFTPGLPNGLPDLPTLGETMQRGLQSGLALNGFDPIAYRLEGRPVAGRSDYELDHRGTVWRFASAANRDAFRDAPGIYEPAFGGFDPTSVAQGFAAESDPRRFAVVGGRLFLFRSEENRAALLADPAAIARAERAWPAVRLSVAR